MILHYAFTQLPGAVFGLAFGAFIPSVLRKFKALVTKEATYLKSEAAKVEKKL
jgi:hypothetical protein